MKKIRVLPALCAAAILASGCSANVKGTLRQGGAALLTVETGLEKGMASLVRQFQALAGGSLSSAALIIDGKAIALSMENAPGIEAASFRNTSPEAIEGNIEVGDIGDFLALAAPEGKARRFITYTEEPGGAHGNIVIALGLADAPEVIALLSVEAADYLSALMAPAATGEALTRGEYLALVEAVYGKNIADEIRGAKIVAEARFPSPVKTVKGGVAAGGAARFEAPLLDLLVLDKPLRYEAAW
jgi:hypothetical protein